MKSGESRRGKILSMRKLAVLVAVASLAAVSACAPKVIPAPVVTTPRFPEFIPPVVPAALAGTRAAVFFDRGWRFLQAGDLRNAEHEFALSLQQSSSFYPAEAGAGYISLARRDGKAALPHFDRALEKQPADVSALVGRGEALLLLGRDDDAVGAFDAAIAADPSLGDLRRRVEVLKFRGVERGLADARQAARSGNVDQAIRAYQTAIASSPESAFLHRELGLVLRQKGDADAALEQFRRAVALDPGDAASLAQVGELLEAKADLEGALQAYTSSLDLESNPAVLARLEKIRTALAIAKLPEEYRAIAASAQVTRAELAALVGVRLAAVVQAMTQRDAVLLTDVRNNWAEPWIMAVARAGVLEPNPNHAFQPGGIVRRIDLAQVVSRLLSRIASPAQLKTWQAARTRFPDLAPTHLAYPAAELAVASGVLPVIDDSFQPSRPVTGAEAVAVVERLEQMASLPQRSGGGR